MRLKPIKNAIRDRRIVRLTLDVDGEYVTGFPLALSSEFVLVRQLSDFRIEGFYAIPLWNITSVRAGRFERAVDAIAKRERLIQRIRLPRGIELDSASKLIESLQRKDKSVIIETIGLTLKAKPGESVMLIGRIVAFDDERVSIHNFDASGHWDRKATKVRFDDISALQFDANYIKVWERNLPRRRKSAKPV